MTVSTALPVVYNISGQVDKGKEQRWRQEETTKVHVPLAPIPSFRS
jgi:hypothetical protein